MSVLETTAHCALGGGSAWTDVGIGDHYPLCNGLGGGGSWTDVGIGDHYPLCTGLGGGGAWTPHYGRSIIVASEPSPAAGWWR